MNNKFIFTVCLKTLLVLVFIWLLFKSLSIISLYRTYVFIDIGGEEFYLIPTYKSVSLEDILSLNNIKIGENDISNYDLDKPVKAYSNIKIIKISYKNRKEVTKIPFRVLWSRRYNSNLRDVELQKGVTKTIISEIAEVFHNNVLIKGTIVLNEKTITIEYYRLVLLTKDGKPEVIYDLPKANRMKMVATAYYPGDPLAWGDGTITFLGQKMQRGIVAVDPNIIPLRTRIFVSGYGYGYAGDTGNAIIGNRVDLGVNNAQEEKSWMFRDVIVYILEPSNVY
jgi:3D (Asp-Asp-Asp) domain-containing protein